MKSENIMKQYLISAALYMAATALTVGCTNNPLDEESIQPQQKLVTVTLSTERPAEVGETRTQLNGTAVEWEVNDQISVFIGESTTNYKFTVKEESIEGNKVAFLGEVSEEDAAALAEGTANVLVAYPYSSKITLNSATELKGVAVPAVQELKAGSFASGCNVSVGTLNEDKILKFQNIGGLIRLDVTGNGQTIKMIEITSPDNTLPAGDGTIDATITAPAMSELRHGSTTIALTSEEGVTVNGTTSFFAAALPTAVANGVYTVTFTLADGTWYQTNITAKGTLNRAKIIKLTANLTSAAFQTPEEATNYCYGTANCVLVTDVTKPVSFSIAPHPANNKFIIDATKRTTNPAPAEVVCLWKEYNTSNGLYTGFSRFDVVTAGSTVTITNIVGHGNALLGLRDAENNVLWSFHLWVPDIDPTETIAYESGYDMMPIALGARSTENADDASGCMYQWGRKDPLGRRLANAGRYAPTDSSVSFPMPADATKTGTAGTQTIDWSIANPTTFIINSNAWEPTKSDALWGTTKTIYDPCPAGYKVAPLAAYKTISLQADGTYTTGAVAASNKTDDAFNKGLWFYTGGYHLGTIDFYSAPGRRVNSSGSADRTGTNGHYWSSAGAGGNANGVNITSSSVNTATHTVLKSFGYCVRCVKE